MRVTIRGEIGELMNIDAAYAEMRSLDGNKIMRTTMHYDVIIWDSVNSKEINYPSVLEKDIKFID